MHWLKDGICVITLLILYPQIPNLSQHNTNNFINEIPKHSNKWHIFIKTDTLGYNKEC